MNRIKTLAEIRVALLTLNNVKMKIIEEIMDLRREAKKVEISRRYKYVGPEGPYTGHTALGHQRDNVFYVQVDNRQHHNAYGWHQTKKEFWRLLDEEG